jgi:PAS domain S-box-containing protein
LPDGVLVSDLDGKIMFANDALLRTCEYENADLVGQNLRKLFYPNDISAAVNERDHWSGEASIVTKPGRTIPVSLISSLLRDEAGHPTAMVLVAHDVSRQKEVEAALRSSEEKYAKAFSTSPDAIAITGLDAEGVLEINERFEQITGYTRAQILGHTLNDLGLLDQSRRKEFLMRLRESGSVRDIPYSLERSDGTIVHLLVSGALVEIGGRLRVLTTHRDVTQQQLTERALRFSEERFRTIFEGSGLGILVMDLTGHPLQTNIAFQNFLGYSAEELRGMTFTDFTHPDHREHDLKLFRRLAGGKHTNFELEKRYIRKDGKAVWARLDYFVDQGRPGPAAVHVSDGPGHHRPQGHRTSIAGKRSALPDTDRRSPGGRRHES